MISYDDALSSVAALAQPLGSESVPLAGAHRRVLAQAVEAQVDYPPADVSAMDGYAVRELDLQEREGLIVAGESYPGAACEKPLERGQCVRVFTGARLPPDCDRVVVQETVRREGDLAWFQEPLSPHRHIRRRGFDFRAGDVLLERGRVLDARALVAAAAADLDRLSVWRRPRVSILATGDELAPPGEARLGRDRIPESISFGLTALVQDWGGTVCGVRRLRDDLTKIAEAASEAITGSDLVLITGGASVGEKDHARAAFIELGLDLAFSKVSIKPGKPVWMGRVGGPLVLGLPGNPTSAIVVARLLLAPLIFGLTGREPHSAVEWRSARLAGAVEACGNRETFMRAGWRGDAVEPLANQDSGAQRALADAELLIRRRAGVQACPAGAAVEIIDL